MKSKILGLLAVALLAGPTAANAGYVYKFDVEGGSPYTTGTLEFFSLSLLSTPGPFAIAPLTFAGVTFTQAYFGGTCFGFATASFASGDVLCGFGGDFNSFPPSSVFSTVAYAIPPTAVGNYAFQSSSVSSSLGPFGRSGLINFYDLTISEVPEPGALALLGLGLAGLGLSRRRKT